MFVVHHQPVCDCVCVWQDRGVFSEACCVCCGDDKGLDCCNCGECCLNYCNCCGSPDIEACCDSFCPTRRVSTRSCWLSSVYIVYCIILLYVTHLNKMSWGSAGLYARLNYCQSHVLVDTWMLTVKAIYKL